MHIYINIYILIHICIVLLYFCYMVVTILLFVCHVFLVLGPLSPPAPLVPWPHLVPGPHLVPWPTGPSSVVEERHLICV